MNSQVYGTWAQWAAFVAASAAGLAAWRAWAQARRTFRYQAVGELIREYGRAEMGIAVKKLFDLARDSGFDLRTKDNEAQLIEAYVARCKGARDSPTSLHFQRRLVSVFFQNMNALIGARVLKLREVYAVVTQCSVSVIDILIPLETKAVGPTRGDAPQKEPSEDFKRLAELKALSDQVYAGVTVWTKLRHWWRIRSWKRWRQREVGAMNRAQQWFAWWVVAALSAASITMGALVQAGVQLPLPLLLGFPVPLLLLVRMGHYHLSDAARKRRER